MRVGIPFAAGLRQAWAAGYGLSELRSDVLAGIAVGTVAVPLSMALAIATGVAPQYGLYAAIVASFVIALSGGSRFNISGPTAAFVVILFPIVQQYGLGGLLIATMMAGAILLLMGLAGFGGVIRFVPYPVVLGFTAGIAVVIAVLQLPDFLGLADLSRGTHFLENLGLIMAMLPSIRWIEFALGLGSLLIMLTWNRLKLPVPAPLIGLVAGSIVAWAVNAGFFGDLGAIETIASRFSWETQGGSGQGIPPIPPEFALPWSLPGPDGVPLAVDFELIRALMGPAFVIAILGAIESLLCAVVADGMTRTRHDPNAELVGQGIGNLVTPFFGGMTATAAIARTATSIRSGARSPIAAIVHAAVVLAAVVALSEVLGMVPMAALAALLLIVAWNMSEARRFVHILRSAPAGDVAVLLTCFGLTVIFDMVLAVAVGMGLAAVLFIRRMAGLTRAQAIATTGDPDLAELPPSIAVYGINGPLFFAAAEKALTSIQIVDARVEIVILDLHGVPSMDATAIEALKSLLDGLERDRIRVILCGLPARILLKLRRAGLRKRAGRLGFGRDLRHASVMAKRWHDPNDGGRSVPVAKN